MVQEADIGKLLISVDKLVGNGNEVSLTKKNPPVKNLKTGRITTLIRNMMSIHTEDVCEQRPNRQVFTMQGS